jgi:hypothetical protein
MPNPSYVRALEAAEFIMGPPAIKGIPLWRRGGILAVRLLAERFLALIARQESPASVEHDFLASSKANRRIFGQYAANVYEIADLPGNPGMQFRSDNIVSTVAQLQHDRQDAPVVAIGSVIRNAPGKTLPLFRDRSVWPVIELNQLADSERAPALLDFYAKVLEELLWWCAIPSITVQTPALASYGKTTYLVVAVLPNKQPTVLATLYILSDELRLALGERRDVIDVGFTGKLLATAAMTHMDARGLVLPAAIAPTQVGVTLSADSDAARYGPWLEALRRAGLRCATTRATRSDKRASAERAWHRKGVPLVIGLDRTPGSVTVCSRTPLERTSLPELPGAQRISDLLDAGDARLAATARRVFDSALVDGGHLRSMCQPCTEAAGLAVFGAVIPQTPVLCERCGQAGGRRWFISDEGRFY